jgi:hypothetical protein
MKKPSPTPAKTRPPTRAPMDGEATQMASPTAKMTAPMHMVYLREMRSAMGPAVKPEMAEESSMLETMMPRLISERCENEASNCGMVVIEPMLPVSKPKSSIVRATKAPMAYRRIIGAEARSISPIGRGNLSLGRRTRLV